MVTQVSIICLLLGASRRQWRPCEPDRPVSRIALRNVTHWAHSSSFFFLNRPPFSPPRSSALPQPQLLRMSPRCGFVTCVFVCIVVCTVGPCLQISSEGLLFFHSCRSQNKHPLIQLPPALPAPALPPSSTSVTCKVSIAFLTIPGTRVCMHHSFFLQPMDARVRPLVWVGT